MVSPVGSAAVRKGEASSGSFRVLFDTSSLVKRYASEPGRERVLAVFAQATALVVASHCKLEVASLLLQRRSEGAMSAADFERAWIAAQRDVADMEVVPIDAHVERFAFAAMEHSPMRAGDALHIGCALLANVDLFVTSDPRQADGARRLGLNTEYVSSVLEEPA